MNKILVIIAIAALALFYYYNSSEQKEPFLKYYDAPQVTYKALGSPAVGYNVDWTHTLSQLLPIASEEELKLIQYFNKVQQNFSSFTDGGEQFNELNPTVDDSKSIIDYVLLLINKNLKTQYQLLEQQFVKKEISKSFLRYTINIYIVNRNTENPVDYGSNISFVLYKNIANGTISIPTIELIGSRLNTEDAPYKAFNANSNYYKYLSTTHLALPYKTSASEMLVTEADVQKALADWQAKATDSNFLCFGTVTGTNVHNKEECQNVGGIWDKPAKSEECPYYLANKNYNNKRGGSKAGYCELPIGMKLNGYRFYDKSPEYAPLCYNCKEGNSGPGSIGPCCEEQKDKSLYPNLSSPDYAFPDDLIDRTQSKEQFRERGLSWNRMGEVYEQTHT